jgi:hypothetical protein
MGFWHCLGSPASPFREIASIVQVRVADWSNVSRHGWGTLLRISWGLSQKLGDPHDLFPLMLSGVYSHKNLHCPRIPRVVITCPNAKMRIGTSQEVMENTFHSHTETHSKCKTNTCRYTVVGTYVHTHKDKCTSYTLARPDPHGQNVCVPQTQLMKPHLQGNDGSGAFGSGSGHKVSHLQWN